MNFRALVFPGLAAGLLVAACAQQKSTATASSAAAAAPARSADGPPSPTAILAKLDANGDGAISKAEAKGPLAKDFAQVDANGDGQLSLEELEKAPRPQRGGNRPPRG